MCSTQVLGGGYAGSVSILTRMLDGALPACPRWAFCVVDVRDVANLHLLAMTSPSAAGERFLATAAGGTMSIKVRGNSPLLPTSLLTANPYCDPGPDPPLTRRSLLHAALSC